MACFSHGPHDAGRRTRFPWVHELKVFSRYFSTVYGTVHGIFLSSIVLEFILGRPPRVWVMRESAVPIYATNTLGGLSRLLGLM